MCTQLFFNLDEQLWKLEDTVKLINKAHGDVQLTLQKANQAVGFTINIKKTGTDIFLDAEGSEIIEVVDLNAERGKIWKKFLPNCAGYFRICYDNEQTEEQLFTATTPNVFVLEPPSRTAATISGKSVPYFSQIGT